MSSRAASSELAAGIVAGLATIDVATAAAGAAHPEWIKIAHRGELRCRDGRTYSLDPEKIAARFAADAVDVPIDVHHATVVLAPKGESAPAHGWIKQLEARPDGLYGKPDWLSNGKALLDARTHRYVSPAFHHDQSGAATWLHSVALVSAPALTSMPALASAGHPHPETSMKGLATALGLNESANEAACLAALKDGFVAKAVHEQTLATLTTTTERLTALEKVGRDKEVSALIEGGLKDGKIAPAQKESLTALCATDDGLKNVKAMLAATAPGLRPSGLDGKKPSDGNAAGGGDAVATLTAKARIFQKAQHDAGNMITWAEAVRAVEEQQG